MPKPSTGNRGRPCNPIHVYGAPGDATPRHPSATWLRAIVSCLHGRVSRRWVCGGYRMMNRPCVRWLDSLPAAAHLSLSRVASYVQTFIHTWRLARPAAPGQSPNSPVAPNRPGSINTLHTPNPCLRCVPVWDLDDEDGGHQERQRRGSRLTTAFPPKKSCASRSVATTARHSTPEMNSWAARVSSLSSSQQLRRTREKRACSQKS